MVAIIGMFFQDGLTGSAWGDWANVSHGLAYAQDLWTRGGDAAARGLDYVPPLPLHRLGVNASSARRAVVVSQLRVLGGGGGHQQRAGAGAGAAATFVACWRGPGRGRC